MEEAGDDPITSFGERWGEDNIGSPFDTGPLQQSSSINSSSCLLERWHASVTSSGTSCDFRKGIRERNLVRNYLILIKVNHLALFYSNTSFIVVVVFAEELAAMTAATAPRGSGDVGVAAAMIG